MPLARWRVYEGGPQIWLAPTADDSDGWIASMRHIAIEAGAFVVSVPQFIPASAFPDDFPVALPDGVDVFGRGGACVVSPGGDVIAGPLYDDEGIVIADCDLREALHAKRYFDVVGHYGRADALVPSHQNLRFSAPTTSDSSPPTAAPELWVSVRRQQSGQGARQSAHLVEVQHSDPFGRDTEATHTRRGQLIAPPVALFLTEVPDGRVAVLRRHAQRCRIRVRSDRLPWLTPRRSTRGPPQ